LSGSGKDFALGHGGFAVGSQGDAASKLALLYDPMRIVRAGTAKIVKILSNTEMAVLT
jgi:hypothetical protein